MDDLFALIAAAFFLVQFIAIMVIGSRVWDMREHAVKQTKLLKSIAENTQTSDFHLADLVQAVKPPAPTEYQAPDEPPAG